LCIVHYALCIALFYQNKIILDTKNKNKIMVMGYSNKFRIVMGW